MTGKAGWEWIDILQDCRKDPSEFGRIAQVLLCMVFSGLGASRLYNRWNAHPDLELNFRNNTLRIEAEHISETKDAVEIAGEDLECIKPRGRGEKGYMAFLDMHFVPKWLLIEQSMLRSKKYSTAYLFGIRDAAFSKEVTFAFRKITEEFGEVAKAGGSSGLMESARNRFADKIIPV